ncbi:hypothetical protein [Kitasatospora sp. CB01950]|uniref:hypothetical protein n=1 Tax=Kitasatospora sp. CB01950 TaxID=1703930 RepID=UPI000939B41B|nr:hypothetical protein [Kitasatospora sp. CB01950]OKI95070.1 hypothetical protein AMK19_32890 [Kitasatospora sp. CB01950]
MNIMTDSLGAGRSVPVAKKQTGIADLQSQYEGKVLALVVRDLAPVDPKAGEGIVMELVTRVWGMAERHAATAGRTTWAHLSWFAHHVVANRQQTAGC